MKNSLNWRLKMTCSVNLPVLMKPFGVIESVMESVA